MICIIKANVTIVALNATGIASCLKCFKSTDLDGSNPAGKRVAFDTFRMVAPADLLQALSPRVVAQLWLARKSASKFCDMRNFRLQNQPAPKLWRASADLEWMCTLLLRQTYVTCCVEAGSV